MAKSLNETPQTNPRNSCFLGCFGFSMKTKPGGKPTRKKTRSISWSMFRLSLRKSRAKTVPIDNPDKAEVDYSKTKTSKLKTKTSSKPNKPSCQNSKADQRLASTNQFTREIPKETRQPQGLPKAKKSQTKWSQTVSLPVQEGSQVVVNTQIHAPVNSKNLRLKKSKVVEKFDPMMMGMSIIIVTLLIMLLWGRLGAILCTSAWLYYCPCLRTKINSNNDNVQSVENSNDLYLNSKEYKKKVVLEGLLERNHRITL